MMEQSTTALPLIMANLDVEDQLSRLHAKKSSSKDLRGAAKLSKAAQVATSVAGSLLRIFAETHSQVALPRPNSVQLPEFTEIPHCDLVKFDSVNIKQRTPAKLATLWWCKLDKEVAKAPSPMPRSASDLSCYWQQQGNSQQTLLEVCNRRFASEHCSSYLEPALTGTEVSTMLQVQQALAQWPEAWRATAWVLKASYSAAGRARFFGEGQHFDSQQVQRFLSQNGSAILQPWLQREQDYGLCAWVGETDTKVLSRHRLLVTKRGAFRGLELYLHNQNLPSASIQVQQQLDQQLHLTANALRQQGFRGPFSIDAASYSHGGQRHLHPQLEINARMSFGLVARLWVDRLQQKLLLPKEGSEQLVSLQFAQQLPPEAENKVQIELACAQPEEERKSKGPVAFLSTAFTKIKSN